MAQNFNMPNYYASYVNEMNCRASSSSGSSEVQATKTKRKKQLNSEFVCRQRKAANERERKRMCSINKGYDQLRLRLPTLPYEKKLSKVDTLKQAIKYIRQLSEMVNECSSLRDKTEIPAAQQTPRLIITSPNNPNSDVLSLSWWKSSEQYGEAIRDEKGVPHVRCAKVWVPDVLIGND